MPNRKITELPAATLPITTGVKFEAVQGGVNVQVDADDMPGSGGGGGGTWGSITGTLSSQTDLQSALDAKAATTYVDTELALKTNQLISYRNLTVDHTLDSTDLASINAGEALTIEEDQAIANDITVPANASVAFPIGTVITIIQQGAGLTSIIADGGVTINTSAGHLNSPGQYSPMTLIKKATNTWYLFNGLPASTAVPQNWGASLTPAGFSSVSVQRSYYQDDGQIVSVYVEISGTSNATTFQFSLPIALDATIYTTNSFMINVFIQNVGAGAAGRIYASGAGTLVTVDATVAGGAFTASGTKALKAHLFYFK